jgi:hypothetical protein
MTRIFPGENGDSHGTKFMISALGKISGLLKDIDISYMR